MTFDGFEGRFGEEFPNQINFHLALTPVTLESKPFCVWMGGLRERRTPTYVYRHSKPFKRPFEAAFKAFERPLKGLKEASKGRFRRPPESRLLAGERPRGPGQEGLVPGHRHALHSEGGSKAGGHRRQLLHINTWAHRYMYDPEKHLQAT